MMASLIGQAETRRNIWRSYDVPISYCFFWTQKVHIATVVCTGLVGGGLLQFVLLYAELWSLMQGGQGIYKILRQGIDVIRFLFSEHSLFYFFMFVFPEFF